MVYTVIFNRVASGDTPPSASSSSLAILYNQFTPPDVSDTTRLPSCVGHVGRCELAIVVDPPTDGITLDD